MVITAAVITAVNTTVITAAVTKKSRPWGNAVSHSEKRQISLFQTVTLIVHLSVDMCAKFGDWIPVSSL